MNMEFLDPVAKRKRLRHLYIGYLLMTILIGLGTYIMIALATGFDVFNFHGEAVQNGLLFVDSDPDSATVALNGKTEASRTNAKYVLRGDDYNVKVQLDGYRAWQKKVSVIGGQVKFVSYIKLIPETLSPGVVATLQPNGGFVSQSLDRRWLAIQAVANLPTLDIYDLSSSTPKVTSALLPTELLTAKDGNYGTFDVIEWSDDNRHFLLQQTSPDNKKSFIVVDRENIGQSFSVNASLATEPTKVALRNHKYDQYYLYYGETGEIKTGDLKAKTVGLALIDQVLSFKSYGSDIILYATTKDAQAGQTAIKIYDGSKSYTMTNSDFDPSSNYNLSVANYDNNWYYMVGSHQTDRVLVFRNPLKTITSVPAKLASPVTVLKAGVTDVADFSPGMRFALSLSGQQAVVYDFEESAFYRYNLANKIDTGTTLAWVDNFHLGYTSGGKFHIAEFDGQNDRELVATKAPYTGYFDADQTQLFTITNLGDKTVLETTPLKK